MKVSVNGGTPSSWIVYKGTSHYKVDDLGTGILHTSKRYITNKIEGTNQQYIAISNKHGETTIRHIGGPRV